MAKLSDSEASTLIRTPPSRAVDPDAGLAGRPETATLSAEQELFGKYALVRKLGSGGMADVWLARVDGPGGFEKDVVVKRIKRELVRKQRAIDMFLREARTAAKLNHPNVVQIYDLGEQDGEYYLAMELLEGLSWAEVALRSWNAGESLPLEVVLQAMVDALRGLEHAHSHTDREGRPAGLVHRDISPDNLFLTKPGMTKVLDFGIAKQMDGDVLTQSGELHGKVPYMPPEQLKGEQLGGRRDVWSLGMTLMWLTTGQRGFDRKTPMLTMHAIIDEPATAPSVSNSAVPPSVDAIVLRALAKRRADRFQSAGEMADAIEALLPPRSTAQEAVRLCAAARALPDVAEASVPLHAARPTSALSGRPTSSRRASLERAVDATAEHPRPDSSSRALLYVGAGGAATFAAAIAAMLWFVDAPAVDGPVAPGRAVATAPARVVDAPAVVAPARVVDAPAVVAPAVVAAAPVDDAQGSQEAAVVEAARPAKRAPSKPRAAAVAPVAPVAPVVVAAAPAAPAVAADDPDWVTLSVQAPSSIEWTCPQGRHLGDGAGTLRFHKLITTIYAVDKARGVRTRFDLKDGDADYTRVPRARLSIAAPGGTAVFLGGERVGTGPNVAVDVVAGTYTVKAVKDGAARTAQVTIEAGRPAAVRIE